MKKQLSQFRKVYWRTSNIYVNCYHILDQYWSTEDLFIDQNAWCLRHRSDACHFLTASLSINTYLFIWARESPMSSFEVLWNIKTMIASLTSLHESEKLFYWHLLNLFELVWKLRKGEKTHNRNCEMVHAYVALRISQIKFADCEDAIDPFCAVHHAQESLYILSWSNLIEVKSLLLVQTSILNTNISWQIFLSQHISYLFDFNFTVILKTFY